jgi:D-methionine transport system substrate-binding protein
MNTLWRTGLGALAVAALALGTASCGSDDDATATAGSGSSAPKTVTVTIGGGADNPLETGVLKYAAEEVAPAHGVKLEVKQLADSNALSTAVNNGDLDAHLAVHWPYLKGILAENGWKLKPVVDVYVSLYSLRSKKYTSIDALPKGATIAVPDDPTNQAIALNLLAGKGLFTLKSGVDPTQTTPKDIADNPKGFKIKPLVAAQIPRVLDELDAALVQASYFQAAGIKPEGALFTEPADKSYAITVIAKDTWESDPRVNKLPEVFKDPKIAKYITDNYGEIATPANPA